MPANTAAPWSIIYALPVDEIKAFPAEVDQVKAERIAKLMGEKWLTTKSRSASYTAASGELGVMTKTGETVTLPSAATSNQVIGVTSGNGITTKITSASGIYGDFIVNQNTITLLSNQHVTLYSWEGAWLIIAGEPKREQTYSTKAYTQAEWAAGIVFSTARPVQVIPGASVSVVSIGGASINLTLPAFEVPAGQSVIATTSGSVTVAMLSR